MHRVRDARVFVLSTLKKKKKKQPRAPMVRKHPYQVCSRLAVNPLELGDDTDLAEYHNCGESITRISIRRGCE